jgi:hypothetical protein
MIETPPFDAIAGQPNPFSGFGQILPNSVELWNRLQKEAADAQQRLQEGFRVKLSSPREVPNELDKLIAGMWESGWDPQSGNVNLFTRDLGCVLTKSILDLLGGLPIFRSETDVSHLSVFWAGAGFEAFPFHKVLKCLYSQHGETMASFMDGIASKTRAENTN